MAPAPLPARLIEADARLHALLGRHAWSDHLNPADGGEAARRAFATNPDRAPTIEYRPLPDADDHLAELAAIEVPDDHPLGPPLRAAVRETAACVTALKERSRESFDAWNTMCRWYPTSDDLEVDPPSLPPRPAAEPTVSPLMLQAALRAALRERGWDDWRVELADAMASRVLVDARRRLVKVNPRARFRDSDVAALVAHEIDVHARRAVEGYRQPLTLFATGLPGSLAAEEGLALVAEEQVGTLSSSAVRGQRLVAEATLVAREAGFVDLFRWLAERVGPSSAWTATLRLKRGLARPDEPGVYAKDAVYHLGYTRVRRLVEAGGGGWLFVGKVSLDDPVESWARDGLVAPPSGVPPWINPPG